MNFTPVGVPAGFGVNVGVADGFSLGGYGEVGLRMGGTGFGFGSTVSQSFDYNFSSQTASTTTSAGTYGSVGAFNFGVNASYSYDITHKQGNFGWAATAGVGVGDGQSGMGLNVGYGSNGVIWGIGGWSHTAADNRAIAARSAKASNAQGKKGQATFIVADEEAKAYVKSMAGRPMEEIVSGLASMGYEVGSDNTIRRAFFSGDGTEAKAVLDGHTTLSQTRAGQNLTKMTEGMPFYPGSQAYNWWARLSSAYAKSIPVGSHVKVYVNNPSPTGIWNMVEKPILQQRGVNIIYKKR